jgi:hypothetical protein
MPFQKRTTSESHKVVKRPNVAKKTAGKTAEELAELRKKAGVERPTQ